MIKRFKEINESNKPSIDKFIKQYGADYKTKFNKLIDDFYVEFSEFCAGEKCEYKDEYAREALKKIVKL